MGTGGMMGMGGGRCLPPPPRSAALPQDSAPLPAPSGGGRRGRRRRNGAAGCSALTAGRPGIRAAPLGGGDAAPLRPARTPPSRSELLDDRRWVVVFFFLMTSRG